MNRRLRRGDRFNCSALTACGFAINWGDGNNPQIDSTMLTVSHHPTSYRITEKKDGGWERKVEKTIDPIAGDFSKAVFRVVATAMIGGGQEQGGGRYPDMFRVTAETDDGLCLEFYQDEGGEDMLPPSKITLIGEDK